VLKEVVLSWRTSPEDRWQEVRDTTYPFEFTIPLAPAEQAFEFFVDATRVNGNPARSETGRLQRSAP
jgi:hypothetical protein